MIMYCFIQFAYFYEIHVQNLINLLIYMREKIKAIEIIAFSNIKPTVHNKSKNRKKYHKMV